MGFYKTKLKTYLKSISLTPENFEIARGKITDGLQDYLHQQYAERRVANLTNNYGIYDIVNIDELDRNIMLITQEIKFLNSLSTEDFYRYLVNRENYTLVELADRQRTLRDEFAKKVDKYQNQKGLSGKATAAFGLDKRKIRKHKGYMEQAETNLGHIEDSRKELNQLSDAEQVAYMIGRFEVDKKVRFDDKGFEEYINALNAAKAQETQGNESAK